MIVTNIWLIINLYIFNYGHRPLYEHLQLFSFFQKNLCLDILTLFSDHII